MIYLANSREMKSIDTYSIENTGYSLSGVNGTRCLCHGSAYL